MNIVSSLVSQRFSVPAFLLGLLSAALCNSVVQSAPVDLAPPANSLGSMDRMGYLRLFQDLGRVEMGGVEVPVRLDFSSNRLSDVSDPGWRGWRCGLLESSAGPWNGLEYLRVDLLCAKVLYLKRDADEKNTYTSPDGSWKGSLAAGRIRIWRHDGWELIFSGGRIDRLETDLGDAFVWERDDAGKFLLLREEDGPTLLGAEWDAGRTKLRALFTPQARFEFSYDGTGDLAEVAWDRHTGLPRRLGVELGDASLELNSDRDGTTSYQWNAEDGRLVKDSLGDYRVIADEGGPGRHRLMLRRNDGAVLVRLDDEAKGISIRSRADGSRIVERRHTTEGAIHDSVARVDWISGDESIILLRNHYGIGGQLVKREWRGDPREHEGFANGRVDRAFTPERTLAFPDQMIPESVDSSAAMVLHIIEFQYDHRGRHLRTTLDGETVYRIEFDVSGRVVLEEIPGRFRTVQLYGDDGRVSTSVTPLDSTATGVYHRDPGSRSGVVRIGTVTDASGRVLEERFIDGRQDIHRFDEAGQLSETKTYAANGTSLIATRRLVYHLDGRRRYEEHQDLTTRRIYHLEVYLAADGSVARQIGIPAAPAWVASAMTPEGKSGEAAPHSNSEDI